SLLFVCNGENQDDQFGNFVCDAGDVNLDGNPDLVVAAQLWDDSVLGGSDHGRMYVYSGKDGALLFTYQGEQAGTNVGRSVSKAQDQNQDGYPDLVAGAHSWDNLSMGTSSTHGRMY